MTTPWVVLTALTALAAAACGGAFLTYSTFTTRALGRLPGPSGLAAMQEVNRAAPRSASFMALVFGPALLGVVLAVRAVLAWQGPASALVIAGALTHLLGVAVVTAAFHVPRNDRLARLDPQTDAGSWPGWLRSWVAGNHVRTVSGLLAGTLLLASLLV
ncbi:anthrone oxygenase family protein [Auraticoccus monumenti]|uniref:Uncharacterized membrane protein n=1 Tax=Auraticoccus monumenti TaxID=675864 RepID=A0A1G6TXY1_9ACTN|nr:anthrone oxygenase family protein [Auraticoccus monumenti]SDD33227.1 Uncharacterized membrane protein [Auraticoccus monumenti]